MQTPTIHAPAYANLSPQMKIQNLHSFAGPQHLVAGSKFTMKSTAYNFLNPEISAQRGTPLVHAAETRGGVYGGNIGV